jgi:hypothetical protein
MPQLLHTHGGLCGLDAAIHDEIHPICHLIVNLLSTPFMFTSAKVHCTILRSNHASQSTFHMFRGPAIVEDVASGLDYNKSNASRYAVKYVDETGILLVSRTDLSTRFDSVRDRCSR